MLHLGLCQGGQATLATSRRLRTARSIDALKRVVIPNLTSLRGDATVSTTDGRMRRSREAGLPYVSVNFGNARFEYK
jgi:hypothetical protein